MLSSGNRMSLNGTRVVFEKLIRKAEERMNLSDSTRKYITAGLALFVVISIFVSIGLGKKQDAAFQENEIQYAMVAEQLQQGHFEAALESAGPLEKNQRNSENVNYVIALTAVNAGDIEKGLRHMQRALDLNPYKVEDAIFMLQYAEMLVVEEKVDEATQVLTRAEALPAPEEYPQYEERIQELKDHLATLSSANSQ